MKNIFNKLGYTTKSLVGGALVVTTGVVGVALAVNAVQSSQNPAQLNNNNYYAGGSSYSQTGGGNLQQYGSVRPEAASSSLVRTGNAGGAVTTRVTPSSASSGNNGSAGFSDSGYSGGMGGVNLPSDNRTLGGMGIQQTAGLQSEYSAMMQQGIMPEDPNAGSAGGIGAAGGGASQSALNAYRGRNMGSSGGGSSGGSSFGGSNNRTGGAGAGDARGAADVTAPSARGVGPTSDVNARGGRISGMNQGNRNMQSETGSNKAAEAQENKRGQLGYIKAKQLALATDSSAKAPGAIGSVYQGVDVGSGVEMDGTVSTAGATDLKHGADEVTAKMREKGDEEKAAEDTLNEKVKNSTKNLIVGYLVIAGLIVGLTAAVNAAKAGGPYTAALWIAAGVAQAAIVGLIAALTVDIFSYKSGPVLKTIALVLAGIAGVFCGLAWAGKLSSLGSQKNTAAKGAEVAGEAAKAGKFGSFMGDVGKGSLMGFVQNIVGQLFKK